MKVESGIGNGKWAAVDKHNRLETQSESASIEHTISKRDAEAYSALFDASLTDSDGSGKVVCAVLKNTSTTKDLVLSHMTFQVISPAGGTSLPDTGNFFCILKGREFSSGGTAVTPVNLHLGAGNVAAVDAYDNNPTMSGSAVEVDRIYPKEDGQLVDVSAFRNGSLIMNPGQTIELAMLNDHTSGTVVVTTQFFLEDIDLEN